MRPIRLSIVAISVFLISNILAAQQVDTVPVVILLSDSSGAGISHAQVRVIPAPDAGGRVGGMETDAEGRLTLDLKPGGYAVFACAPAFKAVAAHIDVARNDAAARAPQTFSLVTSVVIGGPVVVPEAPKADLHVTAYTSRTPLGFSVGDLKALPHITVTLHNSHTDADETYSGVRLVDLLGKLGAPLGSELRGKALASYVVATGSDGYRAVLALGEVDPSFHPGEVLVADSMNGKPLDEHSGPLKLVVTEDKRPARSVRNLIFIELKSPPQEGPQ